MPVSKKFTFKHECNLPKEEQDILPRVSPFAHQFVKFCHRFRDYTTIAKSYESLQFFRSNASLLKEKKRHLGTPRYSHIIHPFSKLARQEEIVMCFSWLTIFVVDPLMGSFMAKTIFNPNLNILLIELVVLCFNVTLLLNIIMKFFTGYIIEQTREIVLEPKRIVRSYLTTYFVCDIAPVLSSIFLYIFSRQIDPKFQLVIFQMHLLRLLRIKTATEYLDRIMTRWTISESVRICVILFTLAVLVVHWWTCILGLVTLLHEMQGVSNEDSWTVHLENARKQHEFLLKDVNKEEVEFGLTRYYISYMTVVMCHFYGAGFGHYRTDNGAEMMILSLVLMSGLVFYVYTLSVVLRLFGIINVSEAKFEELYSQVFDYMAVKRIPVDLKKRIVKYFDFKYDKKFFSERRILGLLSEHLQMEVVLHNHRHFIERTVVFKTLSRAAVGAILGRMKEEIYLAGDVIMAPDDVYGKFYFLSFGTCCSMLVSGKEVAHHEDGSAFTDSVDLIKGVERTIPYSIVAVEPCEIYYLENNDLKYIIIQSPDAMQKIQALVKAGTIRNNEILARAMYEDQIRSEDIVAELRRGRILEDGRRRSS